MGKPLRARPISQAAAIMAAAFMTGAGSYLTPSGPARAADSMSEMPRKFNLDCIGTSTSSPTRGGAEKSVQYWAKISVDLDQKKWCFVYGCGDPRRCYSRLALAAETKQPPCKLEDIKYVGEDMIEFVADRAHLDIPGRSVQMAYNIKMRRFAVSDSSPAGLESVSTTCDVRKFQPKVTEKDAQAMYDRGLPRK
jgi:hypothetical protein